MTFFVCLLTISLITLIIFEIPLCYLYPDKCEKHCQTFLDAKSKCYGLNSTLPIFYNEDDFKYVRKLMDNEKKWISDCKLNNLFKSLRGRIWIDMVITLQNTREYIREYSRYPWRKPPNTFWRNNQSNYYPNINWEISGQATCMTIMVYENNPVFADFACNGSQKFICVNSK